MNWDKRYPSIPDMEAAAAKRMPRFVHDYLVGGLGLEGAVSRNQAALQDVLLLPRYLSDARDVQLETTILGKTYAAPFGIAPLGLAGLLWPNAERILATAAQAHNVPYMLSTYGNISLEALKTETNVDAWFQFYPPEPADLETDLLQRAQNAGYNTLILTVDIPVATRRERDIRNGITVPPTFNLNTLWQMVTHPGWALRMLRMGIPEFETLKPYYPPGPSVTTSVKFIAEKMEGHITPQRFKRIRDQWPGTIVVKGILNPQDAQDYLALGADGLIVSNHGGRQFDAAPAAPTVLPMIRKAVGDDVLLMADGGVRSGLDIARLLALGADFVLIGRPFIYALAAMDKHGGNQVLWLLQQELQQALAQLGCDSVAKLPAFLFEPHD